MSYSLPIIKGMSSQLRGGRSPMEGVQRGYGVHFGVITEHVKNDPLYQEAEKMTQGSSILWWPKQMNIFLLFKFFLQKLPFGHVIEYGSYKGGSAIFMAWLAKKLYPGMKVIAIDSFAGMPPTDGTVDMHQEGDFKDTSYENLVQYAKSIGLDNLVVIKSLFEDIPPQDIKNLGPFRLAHIDCDIASAVAYSYDQVKSLMVGGGYIIFDDAMSSTCPGATEVVENLVIARDRKNSEQIWPHFVFRADQV